MLYIYLAPGESPVTLGEGPGDTGSRGEGVAQQWSTGQHEAASGGHRPAGGTGQRRSVSPTFTQPDISYSAQRAELKGSFNHIP